MLSNLIRHVIAAVLLGLVISGPLAAFRFQKADDVYLSGEFQEDLILAGGTVNFDGSIIGDLMVASRTLSFDGSIDGNLNAAGQRITVNGEIRRSLRAFAQTVNVNSHIEGDVTAFASEVTISGDAVIGRDVAIFGSEVFLDGTVASDAYIFANIVTITGRIEGNLKIKAEKISIAPGAYVGGSFNYESKDKAKIAPESQILGETRWKKRTGDTNSNILHLLIPPPSGIIWSFVFLAGSIIVGILLILIRRDAVNAVIDEIRTNGAIAGILGLAIIVLMPVALVLTGATIVGLPASIAGATVYTLFFFIGKVFVAITIGMLLISQLRKGKSVSLGWSLLVGLIILALLFKIPVLGWLIYVGAWAVGAGAIVLRVFRNKPTLVAEAIAAE